MSNNTRNRMGATASGRFALAGPGKAGTVIAKALVGAGWEPIAVSGRSPEALSTHRAARALGAQVRPIDQLGVDADLVVVAVPDSAIDEVAAALSSSIKSGALVVHLSGARGIEALDSLRAARPDARFGAIHPLLTFSTLDEPAAFLKGVFAAVDGDSQAHEIAASLGLRPFMIAESDRAAYHATACIASNHLVGLMGEVEALASRIGVPFEAFFPLARHALENVTTQGPSSALTGPVARGDTQTIEAHLAALTPAERAQYVAGARGALALASRADPVLEAILTAASFPAAGLPVTRETASTS